MSGLAAVLAAGTLGSGVVAARPWIARLSEPPQGTARGVLLEVVGAGFGAPERIILLDDEGRTWEFRVDPEVATNREQPQSAGHLRQHMAFVDPVLVRYRETPEGLVAVRILDPSE